MSPRIKPVVAFSIIIFLVIVIGGAFKLISRDGDIVEKDIPTPRACTEEAKLCPDGKTSVGRTGPNCEFAACPEIVGIADKIIISSPKTDEIVSSPVAVSGKARGSWFFEGSFPVEIYDSNDKLMGQAPVNFVQQSENDTWMTEDFVDFQGRIEFSQPATDSGYMLFKKDNPSDNPELDESFKLPIKFGKNADISNWQTYRNEKVGFSVDYPSDWGPVTTEVFRNAISGKGEEFYAYFSNKNFIIESKTPDFKPWGEPNPYLGTDPFQYCKKVAVSMDDCKKIDKNITIFSYGEKTEEIIELMRKAVINNLSNKYKGLTIFYRFPGYKKNISSMGDEEINKIIKEQISKFDKNTINTFDQILSTFKFIN